MTDIENCSQCVEYIFQVSEKLPDGFYVKIMELLKEFHEHGTNLSQIHEFVESNKDILEPDIYKTLKFYINKESEAFKHLIVIQHSDIDAVSCKTAKVVLCLLLVVIFSCTLVLRYG